MNKPVYLALSVLDISKIAIYEHWYQTKHYGKSKDGNNVELCYMHIDDFIVYVKTMDVYVDHVKDIKERFYMSNCEVDRPLPIGKNKKSD